MTDESIFAAALSIPRPSDRVAYLDRACAGDPALRAEIEALLAAHAADNPLDRPQADLDVTGDHDATDEGPPAAEVGDRIGPYRLMEQIGEGGFGLVFVAEQAEPVRRKVALKVLKPGMDSRDVVARFEAERQALALMDHPNIARVLDAGSTPAGRPFFVMELVRGIPITDFCDAQKLPPADRLALFVHVCQAVQHAHQKGVIHRDLKPSNVLVTVVDGRPVPKVIDFGVAKAVGQSLTEKTIYTRFAQMIGTPLYMSPEQAEMSGVDVDTRADVYALGVLLYELLTGTTPFDRDRFRRAAFDEIRRIIREEDPPRPSTRLTSLGPTLTDVSAARGTDPGKLAGIVRGELDWIVMKCLEKDRNRRYETANGLARDVQRFLGGDAVEACPPTLGYRLRKLYRRNRAAARVAAGFLLVTYAGACGIYFAYQRAVRAEIRTAAQRDEAELNRRRAEEASREADAEKAKVEKANTSLRRLADEQRRTLYDSAMNLAQAAWEAGEPRRASEFLRQAMPKEGEEDLRGFEWHYWNRLAHLGEKTIRLAGIAESQLVPILSPDGTRVFGFNLDPEGRVSRCCLWDADTGRELWNVPAPEGATYCDGCFSRDGRWLAASFAIGKPPGPGVVRVLDTAAGRTVYSVSLRGRNRYATALSSDGSKLALISSGFETSDSFAGFEVVQLPEGKEVFRWPNRAPWRFARLALFSPDESRLLTEVDSPTEITLRMHELETGRQVWQSTTDRLARLYPRFSPDGSLIVCEYCYSDRSNDRIVVRDATDGRELRTLRSPFSSGFSYRLPMYGGAISGSRLAVIRGEQVLVVELGPSEGRATGPSQDAMAETRAFRGHEDSVSSAAFAPGGARLVTVDIGGTVKHWDPAAREPRLARRFGAPSWEGVLPSPDGSRLALFRTPKFDPGQSLRITDGSGRTEVEAALSPGHPLDACFSADGRTLAVLWSDVKTHEFSVLVWDAVHGRELLRKTTERYWQASVSLTPDGSRVAIAMTIRLFPIARDNGLVRAWDVATGRELLTRRETTTTETFRALYSPDGRWVLINPDRIDDGSRRIVWVDAETGGEAATLQLGRHQVPHFALRRDGRRLAVAQVDGASTTVRVWDVEPILRGETPGPVLTLKGAADLLPQVAFSPDGQRILTSGAPVKLWDATTGREVLTLKSSVFSTGYAYFSPDGRKIWDGLDEDGRIWGWDATPVAEAKTQ